MSSPGRERPGGGRLVGSRLGSYELVALLGCGGMGEVYRARDLRLGRDVAIKVLPPEFSEDRRRLQRFEKEARAASALNHPAIVTVYEIGSSNSISYMAMELVDGKTLRVLLSGGPLPVKKLLDIAIPVAEGLACAHEGGIVHRDLKPENIMVSRDGFVKILDFGLAKLTAFEGGADLGGSTLPAATEPGIVLGTVGYMSPEQAAGRPMDVRSDQFSFGSVLYEMAAGKIPFERDTRPETLAAIIRDEPQPIASINPRSPAPLNWIVEQCLSKEPKGRYASTADLARDLSRVREHLSEAVSSASGETLRAASAAGRFPLQAAIAASLALLAIAFAAGQRTGKTSPPRFHQLTFRNDGISTARFAPDGRTVVYGASSEGKPAELYSARPESPEIRSLGRPGADLLSVSSSADMAILVRRGARAPHAPHAVFAFSRDTRLQYGTLARESLAGGTPRELLEDVTEADWAPDGKILAVVHFVGGKNRLEFPIGTTLYETTHWLRRLRVSPDGKHVAFTELKALKVADRDGRVRSLFQEVWEIGWGPGGKEIWFSRVVKGTTEIHGVTLDGRERLISYLPGDFVLDDVSADGRLLLGRVTESSEILGAFPGETRERNLSYFDQSVAADLSADGEVLLFNEARSQIAEENAMYVRRTDGSPAKRLADGWGQALSPDGRFVLSETSDSRLWLIPTGAGQPRTLDIGGLRAGLCGFFPDGKRAFFIGRDPAGASRLYVLDLPDGKARPISPPGVRRPRLSGDGRFAAVVTKDDSWWLYPTEPGVPRRIAGVLPGEEPIRWSGDGKWLYVRGADRLEPGEASLVTRVYRLDPWSGSRQVWKEILPAATTSGGSIDTILFSGDGRICVWSHRRYSSDLFIAEGLK